MTNAITVCMDNFDELVEKHLPHIIKTISTVTGKYVSIDHDEEFVIALQAFAEAIEHYDDSRGTFLSYSGLVIRSRLLTYLKKESTADEFLSLDLLHEQGTELEDPHTQHDALHEDIQLYQQELQKFGLSLDTMADHSPKHKDTRRTAVQVAEQASHNEKIVSDTYRKKKLPIRRVATFCHVTEKIVKTSKHFILGTMLIFILNLSSLIFWIGETR